MFRRSCRVGFTLVELLVVIAIIGVLVALLLPAVQAARESARRTHCSNNLKQIGLGFQGYHDTYKRLPTGGDNGPDIDATTGNPVPRAETIERYCWTYHILPYMEQEAVWEVGQTIINGSNPPRTTAAAKNVLRRTPVAAYYCPSRRQVLPYKSRAKSDYAGNGGTNNTDGVTIRTYAGGVSNPRQNIINLAAVLDGTANTLLAAESRLHLAYMDVASGSCCSDNEDCYTNGWADEVVRRGNFPPEPDITDTSISYSLADRRFGSSHPEGFNAALVDGSVRFVRFSVSPRLFRNLCLRKDGVAIDHGSL